MVRSRFNFFKDALLPTRDFYEEYPDVARMFINEWSTNNTVIWSNFWNELPNALAEIGIDHWDTSMSADSMREAV